MTTNFDRIEEVEALGEKIYKVSEDVLFSQVGSEGVLLCISSGTYYSLNEISLMFWQALSNLKPLAPVIDRITNEYEVERELVSKDLQTFLQYLSDCGIISSSNE